MTTDSHDDRIGSLERQVAALQQMRIEDIFPYSFLSDRIKRLEKKMPDEPECGCEPTEMDEILSQMDKCIETTRCALEEYRDLCDQLDERLAKARAATKRSEKHGVLRRTPGTPAR